MSDWDENPEEFGSTERPGKKAKRRRPPPGVILLIVLILLIPAMILGILLCYAFGTAWFALVYAKNTGPISFGAALGWCVLPYLPADAAKLTLAGVLAVRLYPLLARRRTA